MKQPPIEVEEVTPRRHRRDWAREELAKDRPVKLLLILGQVNYPSFVRIWFICRLLHPRAELADAATIEERMEQHLARIEPCRQRNCVVFRSRTAVIA